MKPEPTKPQPPNLTQADLERVTSSEDSEQLPLRCNDEDCFVPDSELGAAPDQTTPKDDK